MTSEYDRYPSAEGLLGDRVLGPEAMRAVFRLTQLPPTERIDLPAPREVSADTVEKMDAALQSIRSKE